MGWQTWLFLLSTSDVGRNIRTFDSFCVPLEIYVILEF